MKTHRVSSFFFLPFLLSALCLAPFSHVARSASSSTPSPSAVSSLTVSGTNTFLSGSTVNFAAGSTVSVSGTFRVASMLANGVGTANGAVLQIKSKSTIANLSEMISSGALLLTNNTLDNYGLYLGATGSFPYIQGADNGAVYNIQLQPFGGKVGIGMSPINTLDVAGKLGAVDAGLVVSLNNTSAAALNGLIELKRGSTVRGYLGFNASDEIAFLNNIANLVTLSVGNTGNTTLAGSLTIKGPGINLGSGAFAGYDTENNFIYSGGTGGLKIRNAADNATIATVSDGGSGTFAGTIATQGGAASTPASAGAAGVAGTILWDASYIYICVSTNTWKRAAIATW